MAKRQAREVWEYDSMADFNADGGPSGYGIGKVSIAGQLYSCNESKIELVSGVLDQLKSYASKQSLFELPLSSESVTVSLQPNFAGTSYASVQSYPIATGNGSAPIAVNAPFYAPCKLKYFGLDQGRNYYVWKLGDYLDGTYTEFNTSAWLTFATDADSFELDINASGPQIIPMIVDGKLLSKVANIFSAVTAVGTLAADILPNATAATLSAPYATSLAGQYLCDANGQPIAYIKAHAANTAALTLGDNANTRTLQLSGSVNTATVPLGANVYVPAPGNIRKCVKFTFNKTAASNSSAKLRVISIRAPEYIAAVNVSQPYRLYPVKVPEFTMLSVGDSYTGGGYYDFERCSTDQDVAGLFGFTGLMISGIGGTGYYARGASSYKTFGERVASYLMQGLPLNILFIPGGINDSTTADTGQPNKTAILQSIADFYSYLSTNSPGTFIIAVGTFMPQQNQFAAHDGYKTVNDKILSSLQSGVNPFIFISPLTGSIVTHKGYVVNNEPAVANHAQAIFTGSSSLNAAASAAAGNTNIYLNNDLTHPSTAIRGSGDYGLQSGRAYLSKYVLNAVRLALLNF